MDADSWAARLSSTSKRYQYALQSRSSEMFMGFEDIEVDDDTREEFPCPFCTGYFDIVGLSCHIDDEHHLESKNGVFVSFFPSLNFYLFCPNFLEDCAKHDHRHMLFVVIKLIMMIVGYNRFVISYAVSNCSVELFTSYLVVLLLHNSYGSHILCTRMKGRKGGSISTLSLLRRELREGNLQSLFGGSSYLAQSANVAPDPLLSSFILPIGGDLGGAQFNSSVEAVAVTKNTSEQASQRKPESPPLLIEEKKERSRRSEFVQGMLMSTILVDDYL
ncbi:hypothetical protein L1987_78058 [Smallanthus sonchifolius]|uniref:Uncharacterized protein n=1 Tax=Smallanthus sonchifolius TaxID=185202 RepID=A0ACB8ZCN6_9ASTR|nr:hypothetical protein L1987_78058 [Smallanthus sonchifolius]